MRPGKNVGRWSIFLFPTLRFWPNLDFLKSRDGKELRNWHKETKWIFSKRVRKMGSSGVFKLKRPTNFSEYASFFRYVVVRLVIPWVWAFSMEILRTWACEISVYPILSEDELWECAKDKNQGQTAVNQKKLGVILKMFTYLPSEKLQIFLP